MTAPEEVAAAAIRQHLSLDDFEGDQLYEGTIDADELAAAVIGALELREEWAYMGKPYDDEDELDEWSCGHPIITPTQYGSVHEGFDTPVRRFVTGWQTIVEEPK